jgi:type VI secretion system protein ImpC
VTGPVFPAAEDEDFMSVSAPVDGNESPLSLLLERLITPAPPPDGGAGKEDLRRMGGRLALALVRAREKDLLTETVDGLIAQLDAALSRQLNAIIHHPRFRALESAWRNLDYLVRELDFAGNIVLVFINLSKEDLLDDISDAPEITRSGLFRQVYSAEYGQFGGHPIAAIIANYALGPADVPLLQAVSKVAAMSHAPFIAMANPSFFNIRHWEELSGLKNLSSILDMPQYQRWNRFRESEDARYLALTLPGFLLRLPYGAAANPARTFYFEEEADQASHYCWGNPAFVLAARLGESFAASGWCVNILGAPGKKGADISRYDFKITGALQSRIGVGCLIPERLESELANLGFISLVLRQASNELCFLSAHSCWKTPSYRPGNDSAALGGQLSAQLPYMMIMNRLAHYIKIIQRDNVGLWKDKNTLQRELNAWISRYVTSMDDPDPATRIRRPLRRAEIIVHDSDNDWYNITLMVQPHIRHMGASFVLTLASRLDKGM